MSSKSKILIVIILIGFGIGLLIGSCGRSPAEPEPTAELTVSVTEPPVEETPAPPPPVCSTGVTVNGKVFPAAYGERDALLVLKSDYESLFGEIPSDISIPESEMIIVGEDSYLPLSYLIEGYDEFYDSELDRLHYTVTPDVNEIIAGLDIPVLMYHAVSDNCWGADVLFVSPSEMDKQLQYLKDNGYTTITFEDLPRAHEIEKPVLLTFDDGYRDNYTELYPLLKKYNAKATIFVIGNCVGGDLYMTEEMVKELSDSGLVSIQSHTMTHPDLDTLGRDETVYELGYSQLFLTRLTGKRPFVLCYPTGKHSDLTREVAADYYDFGILMTGGDNFLIPRHYVSRNTDIAGFSGLLNS